LTELDDLWQYYNGEYLVAYRPGREALVQAAMGSDFDLLSNWRHAKQHGEEDVKARPRRSTLYPRAPTRFCMSLFCQML
jgi:hypothetical protein